MYKSLDMNLVSIKNMNCAKNEPTFLFSGEVIPITNQRTDSHPCIRFLPMKLKIILELLGYPIFKIWSLENRISEFLARVSEPNFLMLAACCLMLAAWCLMLACCLLLDAWTPARPIHKGFHKGGGGRRPPPFVDGSGKCSSIKHQASSIKLLGYQAMKLLHY